MYLMYTNPTIASTTIIITIITTITIAAMTLPDEPSESSASVQLLVLGLYDSPLPQTTIPVWIYTYEITVCKYV